MNVHKSASAENALSGLKDLLTVVSDPQALKKAISELEAKVRTAEEAEKKLAIRQGKVEAMEAEWFPRCRELAEKDERLGKIADELENEKLKWRTKYAELQKKEKELEENEAKIKAEAEKCKAECEAKEEVAKRVNAEAQKNRADANALLLKVKLVAEQVKGVVGGMND